MSKALYYLLSHKYIDEYIILTIKSVLIHHNFESCGQRKSVKKRIKKVGAIICMFQEREQFVKAGAFTEGLSYKKQLFFEKGY